jgi:hypothetical protein
VHRQRDETTARRNGLPPSHRAGRLRVFTGAMTRARRIRAVILAVKKSTCTFQQLVGAVLSAAVINLSTGCGAMFNDKNTVVPVRVAPDITARVYVDGRYIGESPVSVELTSAESHTIDIEAEGYERQTTRIESRADAGYIILDCVLLVAFVIPGIIAIAVDAGSGDWKVLQMKQVSAQLAPARTTAPKVAPPSAPPPEPPPSVHAPSESVIGVAPNGCQYDAQCKGDRICKAGQCVEPSPAPESVELAEPQR